MKPRRSTFANIAVFLCLIASGGCAPVPEEAAEVPVFEVDSTWPQPFQENWILGGVTGITVDARDHVWVVHSTGGLSFAALGASHDPPTSICCVAAPGIIEFDPEGNVVQAWDVAPGDQGAYVWPSVPHGIFVDHNDYVWVGSRPHHQVLKFTRDGQLVLQIGEFDNSGGSNDRARFDTPADIWVSPETNEAFIADGYGNRRVVVYDGETGEYLRHWGAYGEEPVDDYEFAPIEDAPPPARQFHTVHGIDGSRDGLLYVADRRNNRIQVFRPDGEFIQERIVAPGTLYSGSAHDVALSADPEQRFLYLVDGANHKIWILRRHDLELVGEVGRGGYQAGQFIRPHNLASDSKGNLYTSEVETQRVQRFLLKGPTGG